MAQQLICEMLGIQYPIFQGAMANIADGAFAAACSNAGGLGIIGSGSMDAAALEREIDRCRALTDRPFGVNVMMMNPHVPEIMELLCKKKPAVVTMGAGNPGIWIDALHEAGCRVIPVVSNAALAKRLERAGADALIAEGCEAGGHIGETSTMPLVPQIVDAVKIPVIAAGGIADGRGLLAALCLGACGVQVATCLLASEECPVHENYKQAVLKAKDSSTTVTGRAKKAPVRVLKNAMAREYLRLEGDVENRDALEKMTLGSLRRAVLEGDVEHGSVMMGQSAGLCHEKKPVAEIFAEMTEQAARLAAMHTLQEKLACCKASR